MTIRRFVLIFLIALGLQGAVFAVAYDDLLYLRMPPTVIAAGSRDTFVRCAEHALTRPHLTDQHLDTIATAAQAFGLHALEVRALERRSITTPDDQDVRLRLADALRRAGRFGQSERVYRDLLRTTGGDR